MQMSLCSASCSFWNIPVYTVFIETPDFKGDRIKKNIITSLFGCSIYFNNYRNLINKT